MKKKEHQFGLVVKTHGSRKSAEQAVLTAFSIRVPDDCEFHLKRIPGHKETWMAGARAGHETAFELVMRSLTKLRENLTKPRPTSSA